LTRQINFLNVVRMTKRLCKDVTTNVPLTVVVKRQLSSFGRKYCLRRYLHDHFSTIDWCNLIDLRVPLCINSMVYTFSRSVLPVSRIFESKRSYRRSSRSQILSFSIIRSFGTCTRVCNRHARAISAWRYVVRSPFRHRGHRERSKRSLKFLKFSIGASEKKKRKEKEAGKRESKNAEKRIRCRSSTEFPDKLSNASVLARCHRWNVLVVAC